MEENNTYNTHFNSSNFTDESNFDYDFYISLTNAIIIIQIIECVMMNITNVVLIFILVTSSPLKRPLRNGMMGAITVANLVTGLCGVPLEVDKMIHGSHRHGCLIVWVVWMFVEYLENFVQLWTMVLLLLHHLAQKLGWKMPPAWWNSGRLYQYSLRAAVCLYVLLPWLVALSVVAPVVYNLHYFGEFMDLHLQEYHHRLTLLVMTCFLPGILIVVIGATLAALKLTCLKERRPIAFLTFEPHQSAEAHNTSRLQLTSEDDDPDPTYVHVLVALTTVLLLLPGYALFYKWAVSNDDFKLYILLVYGFCLANNLAPTVQALLWLLLLPDLRARLQQVWAALMGRFLCKRESSPMSASGAAVPTVRFATLTRDD